MTKEEFDALEPGTVFRIYSPKFSDNLRNLEEVFTTETDLDGNPYHYGWDVVKCLGGYIRRIENISSPIHFETEEEILKKAIISLQNIPLEYIKTLYKNGFLTEKYFIKQSLPFSQPGPF